MGADHGQDDVDRKPIRSITTALVVGGGIGGMAAAIALTGRGVAVDLIDIDPEWRVYGAGITITGPTLRAYKQLGMVEDIAEQGAIAPGSAVFTYAGQFLRDLDEPSLEEGLPATGGIMRPVLHRLMQERVRALGIATRLGITVDLLRNVGRGVQATFSDGSEARYDLVIGTDGVNSRVRELSFPHMGGSVRTGQGCWRVSTRRPPTLQKGEMYFGHRFTAGITRCGAEQVYLWLLTPHERRETRFTEAEHFDTMRAHLADFGGNAGWIRDNMKRDDWVNYRPLEAKIQPRPWSDGRIVLLGDAVHATTPHLASGAGMAVESALVLAQELAATDSVEGALAAYEQRRFERCRDVVESSVAIGAAQLAGAPPDRVGGMIGGALHRLAAPF